MNVTCRQSSKADHGPSSFHRQSRSRLCHESGPQSAPEIHVHPRTSNLNVICLRTSLVKSKTSANPYPSKILSAQNNIRWLEARKFLRGNACLMQQHCQSHSQSTRLGCNFRGVKRPDTEGWGLQPQLTRAESVCDLLTTRLLPPSTLVHYHHSTACETKATHSHTFLNKDVCAGMTLGFKKMVSFTELWWCLWSMIASEEF